MVEHPSQSKEPTFFGTFVRYVDSSNGRIGLGGSNHESIAFWSATARNVEINETKNIQQGFVVSKIRTARKTDEEGQNECKRNDR